MRRSPVAILVLASALAVPATLLAHTRHARLVTAPSPRVTTHAQHPQPPSFRHTLAHPRPAATNPHHKARPAARNAARLQRAHTPATLPHHRSRGRLVAARAQPHRLIPQPEGLDRAQRTARLSSPAQQTAVVSLIRPAADRPQLPSIQQAGASPIILPTLYNERGRLIMPAPLVGSHDILVRQNTVADQDGLGRVQDDADLDGMRAKRMLVPIPVNMSLRVDERLPLNRRYCRPWTAQFLANLSRDFYARFGSPLQVNSAVRTVSFQVRLQRTNGNAAPAEGDTASPHLTGQAIDIGKRGLTLPQIAWLRGYLLPLIQSGSVDVEEEFRQSCFHISVYRRYAPADPDLQRYAVTARTTSALAAATLR